MMRITNRFFFLGGAILALPLTASAATVTVAPAGAAAPAMSGGVLFVSALVLGGIAVATLRRSRSATATLVAALALSGSIAAVHRAWATSGIVVSGEDCSERTEFNYAGFQGSSVTSDCPNAIQIVALELCDNDNSTSQLGEALVVNPTCEIGLVLHNGDTCELPVCND